MMSEEAVVLRETTPMNILIVDDEPTIREVAARWRS
jgi:CheY-like chemotaxis protein